ncbi:ATP-grasp domain-containing protein [Acidisoma sp. 7E03]
MPRTVAFGVKKDLQPYIEAAVDRAAFEIAFLDFETARLDGAEIVVPLTLRDIRMLHRHHAAARHRYLAPGPAVMALCHDKKALNERLLDSPFATLIPPLQAPGQRHLPYVLKKREAASGEQSFILRTTEDEGRHADHLGSDQYFCQGYVESPIEYASHMLFADGRLVYHATNQYWMRPHAVKGTGTPPVREITGIAMDEAVIAALAEVVRWLGFEGLCCVDYKIQEGRVWLLEINPRFGFSLFRDINRMLAAYAAALDDRAAPGSP